MRWKLSDVGMLVSAATGAGNVAANLHVSGPDVHARFENCSVCDRGSVCDLITSCQPRCKHLAHQMVSDWTPIEMLRSIEKFVGGTVRIMGFCGFTLVSPD